MLNIRFSHTLIRSILLFALTFAALAQTEAINGSIRGHVTDAAAAAVPGSKIPVVNVSTGYSRSATTDDDGLYLFPNLPLGSYTITIQKEGFETQRHTGVILSAGTEA